MIRRFGLIKSEGSALIILAVISLVTALTFAADNLFFQSILMLFSLVTFIFAVNATQRQLRHPHRLDPAFISGALWMAILLLHSHTSIPALQTILSLLALLVLLPGGLHVLLLVWRSNGRMASVWLIVLVILTLFARNPAGGLLTVTLIFAQIPFKWVRRTDRRESYRSALLSTVFLAAFHAMRLAGFNPATAIPESWSFIAAGSACISAGIIRAAAWVCILRGILLPFKPKRIQSRLRWAFFLNFIVPVILLMAVSVVMLLVSVGGSQAASAKRLLFYYGSQAAEQASQLWEAAHGIRHDPPPEVPFTRAGVLRLEDGSIQTLGSPPAALVNALSADNRFTVEFLRDDTPRWALWIAGFHRAPDGSAAAIAYRVDAAMLAHIRKILGLDLMLTPGIDISLYPLTTTPPESDFITTLTTPSDAADTDFFPVGAVFINSLASLKHTGPTLNIKPLATLKVLATWQSLSRSFMMADFSSQMNLILSSGKSGRISIQAEGEKIAQSTPEDIQSINFLNFIVFLFLVFMGAVFAGVIIISLSLSFLISRKINVSVRLLRAGAEQLHKGNLDHRIPSLTEDELGMLALDFNRMAESLQRYQAEREAVLTERFEQEQLRREVSMAREIQSALLPTCAPAADGIDIAAETRPCRMVGGDYFNFHPLPDGRLFIIIADVAGKGIPAALMVSTLHALLQTAGDHLDNLSETAARLNNFLTRSTPDNKFITAVLAVWNPDDASLALVSAGHEPPILIRQSGETEPIEGGGMLLGVIPETAYQAVTVHLDPGDILCLFTDGITDRQSPGGERFGRDRLVSTLMQTATMQAADIAERIFRDSESFARAQPPPDDQTIIILKMP